MPLKREKKVQTELNEKYKKNLTMEIGLMKSTSSASWGFCDLNDFLNLCPKIATGLPPPTNSREGGIAHHHHPR